MTWPTKKLEEIARIFAGSSAPQASKYFKNGKYSFVRVSDLNGGEIKNIIKTRDYVNDLAVKELRLIKAKKNSIVFPKSGAAILTNSRAILGIDAYIVSHLAVVETNLSYVSPDYLFLFLSNFDMRNLINDPAYPSLKLSDIKEIEIPLPPLSEQKRIVEKIEKLFAKIDEAERLRAETLAASAALLPSAFHQVFNRAKKENWPTKKLGEILKLCDSGTWGDESPNGMPLLRSTNMQNGQLILDDLKFIDVPKDKISRYILREGDILITKSSGSVDHIGKSLYITKEMDGKYGFSNFTQRLRVNVKFALPKWIYLIISNPETRDFLLKVSQTTTGLRNLKIPALKELKIPLPPLSEQKKIVAYLDALSQKSRELQKLQQQTATDFSALRQSILAQIFRQNPSQFSVL